MALISKTPLSGSSSFWAQGGLAASIAPDDSIDLHLEDTVNAGRGMSRLSAARILCKEAPEMVRALESLEVEFDHDEGGNLALSLEGGHSRRRIVHAGGSQTGEYLTRRLLQLVTSSKGIIAYEKVEASSLMLANGRCAGIGTTDGQIEARATVLATGGSAALWQRSTNPPSATGSGLAIAYEAGAKLADLEMIQFHPTALARPGGGKFDGFLLTEALRGEGAKLITEEGKQFVDELAPRDEVAQAILQRAGREGTPSVFLDLREVELDRFANLTEVLNEVGIDPEREPVPVAPAAHYMMGGIATDLNGRTNLASLYAVGECACTGLHGANRLASNSLSECFVFGRRAALAALDEPGPPSGTEVEVAPATNSYVSEESRARLWRFAGIERDGAGLEELLQDENLLARLIGLSALKREESRGVHFRGDFPQNDASYEARHVVVSKGSEARLELWE